MPKVGQGDPKPKRKAKTDKPDKAKLKTWLKEHGVKAATVDAKSMANETQMCADVCDLLGVQSHEYERVRKYRG